MPLSASSASARAVLNGCHRDGASNLPWWKDAVVYQIYPATFKDGNGDGVGDLQGILEKLDYLKALGVDAIWISPFYKSPQHDLGYDISDYTAIHEPYGNLSDMDAIIAEAGRRGIKVLADLVINHTSNEHAWFQESRRSKDDPKRDWYIWRPPRFVDGKRCPPNNWVAAFGGSCWTWDETTQEYYFHIFLPEQPDLNWENPSCREAIYADAVRFWLDRGIAGFRVDTVNMYSKHLDFPDAPTRDKYVEWQPAWDFVCNGPKIHEYLQDMRREALGDAVTIGELPNTPLIQDVLRYISAKSKELDMVIQFDIANLDHRGWRLMKTPWTLPEFKRLTKEAQYLAHPTLDAWAVTFLGNHDQGRACSRFGSDLPEYRVASAKMLATYLLTLSGTPVLYQGDEIGMINMPKEWDVDIEYKDCDTMGFLADARSAAQKGNDPSLVAKAIESVQTTARDHSRTPVQWDSSEHAGFSTTSPAWMRVNDSYKTINVAQQEKDPNSVLAYYRRVIALRKEHKDVFVHGTFSFEESHEADEDTFVYTKKAESGHVAVVVLNFSKETQRYTLPKECPASLRVVLDTGDAGADGELSPFAAKIYM